jgi:hypothetical protein
MKKTSLLFLILFCCIKIFAQSTFIHLEKIEVSGYIFGKDLDPMFFKIKNISDRFTPCKLDIEQAEQLISKFDLKRRKSNKKQRRQYVGYRRGKVRYLLVHVMSYESEKQFSQDFPNWNTEMEVFLVENSKEKSFLYLINLNENTIGYHRDDF